MADWEKAAATGSFFGANLPSGFSHRDDFISTAEEAELAAQIARVEFAAFEMRGVVARRRVAFFGASYDRRNSPSPPIPGFLLPIRDRLAAWAKVEPRDFAMALINDYRLKSKCGPVPLT